MLKNLILLFKLNLNIQKKCIITCFAILLYLRGLCLAGNGFLQRCDSYAAKDFPDFQTEHQNVQHELVI